MSAPTATADYIPDEDVLLFTNGRQRGPAPTPPAQIWMLGLHQPLLHRVTNWARGRDGFMRSRCNTPSRYWVQAPGLILFKGQELPEKCPACQTVEPRRDDAVDPTP